MSVRTIKMVKINELIRKLKNRISYSVILIFAILKFQNIGRSTFGCSKFCRHLVLGCMAIFSVKSLIRSEFYNSLFIYFIYILLYMCHFPEPEDFFNIKNFNQ